MCSRVDHHVHIADAVAGVNRLLRLGADISAHGMCHNLVLAWFMVTHHRELLGFPSPVLGVRVFHVCLHVHVFPVAFRRDEAPARSLRWNDADCRTDHQKYMGDFVW